MLRILGERNCDRWCVEEVKAGEGVDKEEKPGKEKPLPLIGRPSPLHEFELERPLNSIGISHASHPLLNTLKTLRSLVRIERFVHCSSPRMVSYSCKKVVSHSICCDREVSFPIMMAVRLAFEWHPCRFISKCNSQKRLFKCLDSDLLNDSSADAQETPPSDRQVWPLFRPPTSAKASRACGPGS